jgi:diguanylate cyclase (GGDEF)-like protein/PAS domain S-box-containing protein
MNLKLENNNPSLSVDEQLVFQTDTRLVEMNKQLFRYAEDFQQMIERNDELTTNYEVLLESIYKLIKNRNALNNLVKNSPDIHLLTDLNGTIIQANPAAKAIASEQQIILSNLKDWVLPSHHHQFEVAMNSLKQIKVGSSDGKETELHLHCETHKSGILIACVQILLFDQIDATLLHWVVRDVTAIHEHELESQISSLVLDSANEGVMITDEKGDIKAVNPAFTRIIGYTAEEVIGHNPRFIQSGMHNKNFYDELCKSASEGGKWQGMIYSRSKDGRNLPQWLCINAVKNQKDRVLSYIGVFSELSDTPKSEDALRYLAYYDGLTGLPNRSLLQDRIRQTLSQARRADVKFAVIFVDLDFFKRINDLHGHYIGDQVLQEAARRMRSSIREIDTVARPGGDEFILVCPGLYRETGIRQICNKLIENLKQPMLIGNRHYQIGASLGCAIYPHHGDDEITLIKNADVAMYEAKKTGGNTFVIYDSVF